MGMLGLFGKGRQSVDDAAQVDLSASLDDAAFTVLDTELTGLDVKKDSIISIGAVRMTGGRIELGRTLERVVSPRSAISTESVLVTGITPGELQDKPLIGPALDELRAFCSGSIVVGHFVSLDLAFLEREAAQSGRTALGNLAVDTWRVHIWLQYHLDSKMRHFGESGDKDLLSLAKKYHIPVAKAHDALGDAFVTAQLFQRFLRFLPSLGVRTVKELLKIGRP